MYTNNLTIGYQIMPDLTPKPPRKVTMANTLIRASHGLTLG